MEHEYFEALNFNLHILLVFGASFRIVTGYDYFEIRALGEFGGGTIVLEVRANDTVLQIKERIEAQTGNQPCRFNLRFEGHDLKDNETVAHYNIERNSTILMRLVEPPTTTTTTTTTTATPTEIRELRFGIFYTTDMKMRFSHLIHSSIKVYHLTNANGD